MLRFLSVRHLAVIDHLEVEFEPGFNVLTGETGAGKSVLVEALGLLAGGRASADLVRTGEQQTTVQAVFDTNGRDVIVRREVSAQGRSRAFIDDALATSSALKDLGGTLIELHGQHEHHALLNPADHVDLLDAFAHHDALVTATRARYDEWRVAADALIRSQLSDREKQARTELASFQAQEIDKVGPKVGEDESLATERTLLANADKLSRLSRDAYAALYDGDTAALSTLSVAWKRVAELAEVDPRFQAHVDQRDDIKSRLEELVYLLRGYADDLDASPGRLQAVEDRLAALERLKRRFGPTLDDVLARRESLQAELKYLDASEEEMAALIEHERRLRDGFVREARSLSASRMRAAVRLGETLVEDLHHLAMPACRLDVQVRTIEDADAWTSRGIDQVEFFFSPNPGEQLRPLAKIASGGELSRFMLALRIATSSGPARTLIFDEVDAGIGGAAADAVGARLQALGARHQVLCVTHLPQIAARASAHFQISKAIRSGRTITSLVRLDDRGREGEIGRMIGGAAVSAQVLASAREFLVTRQRGEDNTKLGNTSKPEAKAKGKRGA
jgi:DNA repair protein RecN (Recombination protein N)